MKLTDKLIKGLPAPERGNRIVYDAGVKGFGIRVTAAGARAFILTYWSAGRQRRYTIGRYPDWPLATARAEAKKLKLELRANGSDPLARLELERGAPTMTALAQRYLEEHASKRRASSQVDAERIFRMFVLPAFAHKKVAAITFTDCDGLHRKITRRGTKHRANRVIALLSKAFNLSIRWGWRLDNPCRGIERNPEGKRSRYLSADAIYVEYVKGRAVVEAAMEMEHCQWPRLEALDGRPAIVYLISSGGIGRRSIQFFGSIRSRRCIPCLCGAIRRPQRLRSDLHPPRIRVSGRPGGCSSRHRLRSQCRLLFRLLSFPSPDSRIVAVEPDPQNFAMLTRNLAPYGSRVNLINAGVWSHVTWLALSESRYRDGRESNRQVRVSEPSEEVHIEGVDIETLLASSGHDRISILKVDVEGAEAVIFSENYRSWLDKVDAIAIELHDDSVFGNATEVFFTAIEGRGFQVSHSGELTVCRKAAPGRWRGGSR